MLNNQQSTELNTFLGKHHKAFSIDKNERGETSLTVMDIETEDSITKRIPATRMPLAVRRKIARQLDAMQECGIIQPSRSPWSSPVVMVHKKDGSQQFCVDY